jgi:isopenicillin N synthase-like dioxygenase
MESYYLAATGLSQVLQRAFALALGQPNQFFQDLFQRQSSLLKINHYPPQDNPQTVSNIGVVPHSDEIGFTILWQDDNGGLEIESKSGEWVEAPPIPGTFVINLGDLMQIWSDGEFSSTPHRVINRSGVDRYSIPFFANPRWDAPVKPLIGDSRSEGNGENYEQYQLRNWRRIFPIAGVSG